MATMRRKLRFRLGFGLAAGLAVVALLAPGANAAKPKPAPKSGTAAADQYSTPTVVTYVTLTAAKVGKCKQAVVKRYVVKKKACHGKKACLASVAKAQAAATKACNRLAQGVTKPAAKPKAKPKTKKK